VFLPVQIIKAFALVKPAAVKQGVRQLAHELGRYTKEYLAQCKVPERPEGKKQPVLQAEVTGIITWCNQQTQSQQQQQQHQQFHSGVYGQGLQCLSQQHIS
jgi:hypothetical protein